MNLGVVFIGRESLKLGEKAPNIKLILLIHLNLKRNTKIVDFKINFIDALLQSNKDIAKNWISKLSPNIDWKTKMFDFKID